VTPARRESAQDAVERAEWRRRQLRRLSSADARPVVNVDSPGYVRLGLSPLKDWFLNQLTPRPPR
jgi:hypothetical protein